MQKLPKAGNLIKFYVMGRNTSVSFGTYFEEFVENKISEGRYKNISEIIHAGLRLLEEEEEEDKITLLKSALQEGMDSGIAKDFNPKKHLEQLKANKRENG